MKSFLSQIRALRASYRSAPKGSVIDRARHAFIQAVYLPNRNAPPNLLRKLDRFLGARMVNRLYWRIPVLPKPWYVSESRIFHLAVANPEALADFATRAFWRSNDPVTLSSLARSPLTAAVLAQILRSENLGNGARLDRRIRKNTAFAYAMAAIARFQTDPEIAERLFALVDRHIDVSSSKYKSFLSSFGYRPTYPEERTAPCIEPARHRLIIAENTEDKASLSMLFAGADRVSIYSYTDLFGKATFDTADLHAQPRDLIVEHARTRITRFSADYHRLHEESKNAAITVAAEINRLPTLSPLLGANLPFAEMAFADELFFRAIKVAAVAKLLETKEFDHIVVAMQDGANAATFMNLLSTIPELTKDPRVEVISVSRTQLSRTRFLNNWAASQKPLVMPRTAQVTPAIATTAVQRLYGYCASRLDGFPKFEPTEEKRVLYLVAPVGAYNQSSARFYSVLDKAFSMRALQMGSSTGAFRKLLENLGVAADSNKLRGLMLSSKPSSMAMRDVLLRVVTQALPAIESPLMRHVLGLGRVSYVEGLVLPYLTFYSRAEHWFDAMKTAGALPQAIVMTPVRNMYVSSFTALARKNDIPTIALEPHGLNASYCRYSTVSTDYYGVIASFFRTEAANGFEIPADRCPIVGSPRLMAPAVYDVEAARKVARKTLAKSLGVKFGTFAASFTFMSQPSDWVQMSEVWRIILRSTEGLNIQILLKTHPEETASRVHAFLQLAAEEGAAKRVKHIPTDPTTAIEAADLVLSGYSATVVETVLLRHPVACVTNGDNDYPLDQHRVVDAPLWRSVEDMRAGVEAFLADPKPYVKRAEAFLEREAQLIEGPDSRVTELVEKVIAMDPALAIRPVAELPDSSFLPGPFQVYQV